MNASGEKMIGVEALCRWNHPARGNVPPNDFIPIAEGSELIIPLGEWVLRKACLEAKPWAASPSRSTSRRCNSAARTSSR